MIEPGLPADVMGFLNQVFRACNERITEKLTNNPKIPEESLDFAHQEAI